MILSLIKLAFALIDKLVVAKQEEKRRWKRNLIAATKRWQLERHNSAKVHQMFDELDRLIEETRNGATPDR